MDAFDEASRGMTTLQDITQAHFGRTGTVGSQPLSIINFADTLSTDDADHELLDR